MPTPELTRVRTNLGICKSCGHSIIAQPTTRQSEQSQLATVHEGESREEQLVQVYLSYEGGGESKKRPATADIDRDILDSAGRLIAYLEIKERTNSINAYRLTQFPYAKIDAAKQLIKTTGLPVFIVLKFTDCWARITVRLEKEYLRGDHPFAPRYRPSQNQRERQIPVMIPVEELEILPWRDACTD